MSGADYVGIGTLIAAVAAAAVAIINALKQSATRTEIRAVHDEVRTPNGATVGEIVAANDLRDRPGG